MEKAALGESVITEIRCDSLYKTTYDRMNVDNTQSVKSRLNER